MRLQEAAYPADGTGLQFRRLFPGIDRYLGIRRQRCDVDGRLVRVRRGIVRQDKHRRLAVTHELARHAVHEVRPGAVKIVQVFFYGFHRYLGPPGAKLFGPNIPAGIVHHVRVLRPVPDRLAQHARDDALRRPLHQLEGKWAADAVAHDEELADAEVVHQPQLVVGEGAPRVVHRDRARGFAAGGVALVHGDAAEVVLELLHRVDHRGRPTGDPRV